MRRFIIGSKQTVTCCGR